MAALAQSDDLISRRGIALVTSFSQTENVLPKAVCPVG